MFRSILALSLVVFSSSVFAAPDIEGVYQCQIPNSSETKEIEIYQSGGKYHFRGLPNAAANGGIPCENDIKTVELNGMTIAAESVCTDEMLSMDMNIIQSGKNTDVQIFLGLSKAGADALHISVKVNGIISGEAINTDVLLYCNK